MDPLLPTLVVPLENERLPLIPEVPASALRITTDPVDLPVLAPLDSEIVPPVAPVLVPP